MSNSLWPHGLQHTRPPCPSPTPRAYSNSCPWSRWCHPVISSSVIPFSCLQSFPASGSFPMSQLFTSGGQSIGVSASASVLPVNIQGWSPSRWTGWISLQSKGLSRVFSNTIVQKHQFFSAQVSFFFFFSSTTLLLPTHFPPPLCTHAQSCNPMDFSPSDSVHGLFQARILEWVAISFSKCSGVLIVQLSHPYMTTRKTIALTRWTFVDKVMSLLFNMLSRLVITFLPRSKHLLISWMQSPSAVILEPKKKKNL